MSLKELKAITIWQPWASAIALGFKRFETRSWPIRYRGPILIHAAKRWTLNEMRFQAMAVHVLRQTYGCDDPRVAEFEQNPPVGVALCVADIVACHIARTKAADARVKLPIDDFFDDRDVASGIERMFGDFSWDRYAWQLENVVRCKPVPCAGAQGLWTPSAAIRDAISGDL